MSVLIVIVGGTIKYTLISDYVLPFGGASTPSCRVFIRWITLYFNCDMRLIILNFLLAFLLICAKINTFLCIVGLYFKRLMNISMPEYFFLLFDKDIKQI